MSGIMLTLLLILMAAGTAGTASAQDPTPTEAPAIEAPVTEVPATEAPATEPPPAQESGALVNGVAVCPPGFTSDQIDPADCTEPAAGVVFYAANPNTDNVAFGATGSDGVVDFPLDQFAIGGPDDAVSGAAVSCEPAGSGLASSAVQAGGASLAVQFGEVVPGDQIACEWFLSHGSLADDGDDADDDTGGTIVPVTKLPSTGTGAVDGGVRMAFGSPARSSPPPWSPVL